MAVTSLLFPLFNILYAFYIFGKLHNTPAANFPLPRWNLGTQVHTKLLKSCFFRQDRSAGTTLSGY
jgi:hypothetical protein